MAKFLGEGTVTAGGVEWHLRFDMNVLADLEERLGENPVAVLSALDGDNPSIKTLRVVCHAMLKRHHREAGMEVAGDILSEDMEGFMSIITASMPTDGGGALGNARAAAGPVQ